MKKILVPVNFTNYSENAALFAAHFAVTYEASIILFHSNQIPVSYPDVTAESLQLEADEADDISRQRLEELKKKLEKSEPLLKCTIDYTNTTGLDSEEILDAGIRTHADMLLMGTHHMENPFRFLLGSTFNAVLEKTKIPVLVIPPDLRNNLPIKTIVFAVDYDNESNVLHIDDALELARKLNAKLICVHIDLEHKDVNNNKLNSLKKQFQPLVEMGAMNFETVAANNVIEGLNDFTQHEHGGLKIMVKRKRSFFQKIAEKSLSKKIAHNTPTPLLVVPG